MTNRMKLAENELPQTYKVKLLGRRVTQGLWGIKNTRKPVDDMISCAKASNLSLPIVKLQISPLGILITHFPSEISTDSQITQNSQDRVLSDATQKNLKKISMFHNFKKFHNFVSRKTQTNLNEAENKNTKIKQKIEDKKIDFSVLQKMKEDFKLKYDESFFGIDSISYGVQDLIFTRVFTIIVVSENGDKTRFHCYAFICEDRQVARSLTYSLAAAFQVFSRTIRATQPPITITPVRILKPQILSIDLRSPEEKRFGKKIEFSEA